MHQIQKQRNGFKRLLHKVTKEQKNTCSSWKKQKDNMQYNKKGNVKHKNRLHANWNNSYAIIVT